MEFLVSNGFDVSPGKNREFQELVRKNSVALNDSAPEGIQLVASTPVSSEAKKTAAFTRPSGGWTATRYKPFRSGREE